MNWEISEKDKYYNGDDLGLTYSSKKSEFRVWAPTASCVSLMLYNDQGIYNKEGFVTKQSDGTPNFMERQKHGIWAVSWEGDLLGKYYMFKIEFPDGTINYALDPYAHAVSANGQRGAIIDLRATDPGSPLPESMQTTKGKQKDMNIAVFNDHFREGIKGGSDDATKGFATGKEGKEEAIVSGIRGSLIRSDF